MLAFDLLLSGDNTLPVYHQINGESVNKKELLIKIWDKAHALRTAGIKPTSKVILFANDSIQWITVFWALTALGASIIPLLKDESNTQLIQVLRDHVVDYVITDVDITTVYSATIININDIASGNSESFDPYLYNNNELYVCLPTSGTSGGFKLIGHTNISLINSLNGLRQLFKLNNGKVGDSLLCPGRIPFGLAFLVSLLGPVGIGFKAFIGFNPIHFRSLATLFNTYEIKHIIAVPQFLNFMLDTIPKDYILQSLKSVTSGGEILPSSLASKFKNKFNIEVVNLYGLTECFIIAAAPNINNMYLAGPVLYDNIQVRVVDQHGNICSSNQRGIIEVKSPSQFIKYLDNPCATNEVLINGWIHTNDIGMINNNNELIIFGRKSSYFKVRSKWISAIDLENKIEKIAGVSACVVLYNNGNLIVKVATTNYSTDQIKTQILKKVGPSFETVNVEFVNEIMRTATMKKIRCVA